MKFGQLTQARSQLRERALQKEAGAAGSVAKGVGWLAGLPFRGAGYVAGKALKGTSKAVTAPAKGALGGAWKNVSKRHPILAPVMMGAGLVGMGAAAAHGAGKARKYNRGFDPRIQAASSQQIR